MLFGDAELQLHCTYTQHNTHPCRGAASANALQLLDASQDLQRALQLAPEHANAGRYLAAVRARAKREGISLSPPRDLTPPPRKSDPSVQCFDPAAGAVAAPGGSGGEDIARASNDDCGQRGDRGLVPAGACGVA
jgi:hypothetical protein